MSPRVVPAGDAALNIEYDDRLALDVNAQVLACAERIRSLALTGVRDIVPAFRTLTLYVDPAEVDVHALTDAVRQCAEDTGQTPSLHGALIDVPVCYDAECGPDLDAVAAFSDLSREEVIRIHTTGEYRVFMLGFVPGFAYMGLVDPRIAAPRLSTPRLRAPEGAVGIAGQQTGIYPTATPGGWNLVGRTPLRCWRPDAPRPTMFSPGDRVRFRPVAREEFDHLLAAREDRP